jgi:hypothetical protein
MLLHSLLFTVLMCFSSDGSYYYSNSDGSKYYNDGKSSAWYQPSETSGKYRNAGDGWQKDGAY